MAGLLALAGLVGIIAASAMLQGWAMSILWLWFIVPLGMKELNIPMAIGLCLVISVCSYYRPHKSESNDLNETLSNLAMVFIKPILLLAIGWVVKGFL